RAMALSVTETKATIVLLPFTATGKDLAPRLAGKVGAGLASDCVALSLQDGRLQARRPMYAGKLYATVAWEGEPPTATLRPNVFPLGKPDPARKAEVVKGTADTSSRARVTAVHAAAAGKVELGDAQLMGSAARGLK